MFHEVREYYLQFDAVATFLEAFEKLGLPAMRECGWRLEGAYLQDIGPRTGTTFVWLLAWVDLNERSDGLTAFRAHPDFPAFAAALNPLVTHIDTRILRDVSFSPSA
jgi:NIPSNAP